MADQNLVSNPFEQSGIKLDRGNRHLSELLTVFQQWARQVKTVVTYDDPDEPTKVRLNNAPPLNQLAGIIGDVVHNYRASLDLMAIALVRINGLSTRGVYFPFCESSGELDSMISRKNFDRAGPGCVELVKTFQPYRTEEWNPLRALHDLDILDKHQALIPAVGIMHGAMICQYSNHDPPMFQACMPLNWYEVVDGTKVGDGPWLVHRDWMPPFFKGSLDLVFDPTTDLTGKSVLSCLAEFSRVVATISEAFFKLRVGPVENEGIRFPLKPL